MATKRLVFGSDARHNLHQGMDTLVRAMRITLGPQGNAVAYERSAPRIVITRDGGRVAREITLPAPWANMGVQLLKEATAKTKDIAGDGATTTAVLAMSLVDEGLKHIAAGANPMLLWRGLAQAAAVAAQAVREMSLAVQTREDIAAVVTTCMGDRAVGQIIGQVMEKVTYDGVITVTEARGLELEVEYVDGYRFDRGYVSAHFAIHPSFRFDRSSGSSSSDDGWNKEVVVDNPYILVTTQRVSSADDIMPVLRRVVASGKRDLVIVAEEVHGDALTILVVNKQQGKLNCLAVKPPEFGEQYFATLEDLAIATGATLICAEQGFSFRNTTIEQLGQARRVIASRGYTLLVKPSGSPQAIEQRVQQIRGEVQRAANLYERRRLEKRIARLKGLMAIIRVGGHTPAMVQEKRRQLQHAITVARSAVEAGMVPGGGVALLNASAVLAHFASDSDDEAAGVAIMRRALQEPLRCIADHAGQSGATVVATVQRLQTEEDNLYIGYDALDNRYGDMRAKGIMDSARMTCTAIENAASVAGLVLTTEGLVWSNGT
ncbi:MAG: 60 kDa chaperonin 2 [Anaerolineae bacterium]|nr:MAG: 60 kDa chaperonin 2 [Anaerolineae bacterium]